MAVFAVAMRRREVPAAVPAAAPVAA